MKLIPIFALTLLSAVLCPHADPRNMEGRSAMVLDGKAAQVSVDLAGGSIVDFHLKERPRNPLTWDSKPGDTPEPRPRGHFLCLDRWGPASDAETKNGMGFHGEATAVRWKVRGRPKAVDGAVVAEMTATLPIAGLALHRRIALSETAGFFVVRETVTNRNKLGRLYNMVQHPTIGAPFLDTGTVVDTNGRQGFAQGRPVPRPEDPLVFWPEARDADGKPVDVRRLTDRADPGVVSYVIDDPYGWTTASNAREGLLLGYFWKTADYPWIDAWRHAEGGRPFARGLEFGTTGLHQPFPELVKQGKIFGRTIFEYLDAGESATRSYVGFLLRIPPDYQGVAGVELRDGALIVHERDRGPERDLRLEVGTTPLGPG